MKDNSLPKCCCGLMTQIGQIIRHIFSQKIERTEMTCCPICIKPQQHFGSELSFEFNHFTSTMDNYSHQILHHQIIPNTNKFRIEQFESSIQPLMNSHKWILISHQDQPKTIMPFSGQQLKTISCPSLSIPICFSR